VHACIAIAGLIAHACQHAIVAGARWPSDPAARSAGRRQQHTVAHAGRVGPISMPPGSNSWSRGHRWPDQQLRYTHTEKQEINL
jgi:hypothetical protein